MHITREDIILKIRAHSREMAAVGVRRLALFGSVARGEDSPDSDVDVLVAFDGQTTFDQYFDLKFWLEDMLGRPVDLVAEKALRPEMAPEVNREALHIAP